MVTRQRARSVVVCIVVFAVAAASTRAEENPRTITVDDLVRQALLGDPLSLSWNEYEELSPDWSPDGSRVALIVRYGNPQSGTNEADLLLYSTAELARSPKAVRVAHYASSSNAQPLAFVRWRDNETLVFAATNGAERSQAYELQFRSGSIKTLTRATTQLLSIDLARDTRRLVTFAEQQLRAAPDQDPACLREGCRVTASTVYYADRAENEPGSPRVTIYDGEKSRELAAPESVMTNVERCAERFDSSLSPDGRYALWRCISKPDDWPAWWADYTGPVDTYSLATKNARYARTLLLVDLDSGRLAQVSSAPYLYPKVEPLWIDGGFRAVLAGIVEPLDVHDPSERELRRTRLSVGILEPKTGKVSRILRLASEDAAVSGLAWDEPSETLTVRTQDASGHPRATIQLRRHGDRWTARRREGDAAGKPQRPQRRYELDVEQALNKWPTVVAVDQFNGARFPVLDPNPWLAQVKLGYVEAIAWTSRDGSKHRGGLYYPPNFVTGRRYPLVLQTHGFAEGTFSLTGMGRNFAGQALAAHDIAVLQLDDHIESEGTPEEWPSVQAAIEGAIDHLNNLGIADPSRVGIQGWSSTGPQSTYVLTHSDYPFAAAAITSSADNGWWAYMALGAWREMEANYGAAPFDGGFDAWRRLAPTFNMQRVSAPMLMWSEKSALGLWDWYAGLRRLGKPVEYWVLPDGVHEVFKVPERLRTTGLLVDWFRFWLKDEEDAAPAKAEQYARWRSMRDQQHAAKSLQMSTRETEVPAAASE